MLLAEKVNRTIQAVVRMSSKKKKDSKKTAGGGGGGGGWPSPGSGVAAGPLPDAAKSRLWELFGAIEHEFETLHAENAACECARPPLAVRVREAVFREAVMCEKRHM